VESSRLKALESQIAELSPEEVKALADELALRTLLDVATTKTVDWERFNGILKTGSDGLEYQRAVRAEWD
jgi:hypothetical protein